MAFHFNDLYSVHESVSPQHQMHLKNGSVEVDGRKVQ